MMNSAEKVAFLCEIFESFEDHEKPSASKVCEAIGWSANSLCTTLQRLKAQGSPLVERWEAVTPGRNGKRGDFVLPTIFQARLVAGGAPVRAAATKVDSFESAQQEFEDSQPDDDATHIALHNELAAKVKVKSAVDRPPPRQERKRVDILGKPARDTHVEIYDDVQLLATERGLHELEACDELGIEPDRYAAAKATVAQGVKHKRQGGSDHELAQKICTILSPLDMRDRARVLGAVAMLLDISLWRIT